MKRPTTPQTIAILIIAFLAFGIYFNHVVVWKEGMYAPEVRKPVKDTITLDTLHSELRNLAVEDIKP